MKIPIDEPLWRKCVLLCHRAQPKGNRTYGGTIDGVKVYFVSGPWIMLHHDMDFHAGGNGLEDKKLCRHDEVVIDYHEQRHEWPFNLYHELHERRDMVEGMSYDKAHERANNGEKQLRTRHGVGV